MYVYHVDHEDVHDLVDGLLYSIPPQTPYEIPNNFIAGKILEHKHMHGLVQLNTQRTPTGIQFLIEDAHARAIKALADAEQAVIDEYIRTQTEDRMQHGKPAFPPGGRQKSLVDRYKVDLTKFGIRPIGVPIEEKLSPDVKAILDQNQKLLNLVAQLLQSTGVGGKVPVELPVAEQPVEPQTILAPVLPSQPSTPTVLPPANVQAIRGPEAQAPPNPTAEDLGAKVDPESGIVLDSNPAADDPNQVAGAPAPVITEGKGEKKLSKKQIENVMKAVQPDKPTNSMLEE